MMLRLLDWRCRQALLLLIGCSAILAGCAKQYPAEGTPEAAKRFLKARGFDFCHRGFFGAVAASGVPPINALLPAGIDPNVRDSSDGRTALISAAAHGDVPVVKALLNGHAEVNAKDGSGYTALFHSIEARYDDVTDVLLAQPTLDLDARGKNGVTALISFVWRDRADVVKLLLERGAQVNLQDR